MPTAKGLLFIYLFLTSSGSFAQYKTNFLQPDSLPNRGRIIGVSVGSAALFSIVLIGLNEFWYKDYPRSKFQFFNDGREWYGMDKAGHVYGAYLESYYALAAYKWAGVKHPAATWAAGATGIVLQASIEILDGKSAKWGFSGWDFLANAAGSFLLIGQEYLWREQRIILKTSSFPEQYNDEQTRQRARFIFGTTPAERFLKDYNSLTIWASLNLSSFISRDTRLPDWLNIAVGYGANGMLGGFSNSWCVDDAGEPVEDCDGANFVSRTDIRRYPQVYLSFDIDFSKIKAKKPGWRTLLYILNAVKVPGPAIEFNPVDMVKFQPFMF